MNEYDVALKLLLTETGNLITRKLSGGATVERWINVEMPVQNTRVDLLGETAAERLLESDQVGDNIVAVLAGVRDSREAVRRVLERIARLATASEREAALGSLLILAGLRRNLGHTVEEEAKKMPLLNDIRDHEVLGREFR